VTGIDSRRTLRTKRGRKSNPKGVIVTNHAIASASQPYQAAIEILRPDRWITWAPVKNSDAHPIVQRIRSELASVISVTEVNLARVPRALEGEVKGGSSLDGAGKGRLWRKGSRKG
jgi:hypothetical protein